MDTRHASRTHQWLREPLVYFFIAGTLLFGLDRAISAFREEDDIHVPPAVHAATAARLQAALGRAPAEGELRSALQVWVREEAVYREGLRRGLDQSDRVIRDRVVHRTLAALHVEQSPPDIDEAALERWFNANTQRYARPTVFDLEVMTLPAPVGEDALQGVIARLNQAAGEGTEPPPYSRLHIYRDAPEALLLESYGAEFVSTVRVETPGRWLHVSDDKKVTLVRVQRMQPGSTPSIQDIGSQVREDWLREQRQQLLDQRIDRLVQRHRIRLISDNAR